MISIEIKGFIIKQKRFCSVVNQTFYLFRTPSIRIQIELACEKGEGKERGTAKGEPEGMTKYFDFQMPVIYAVFKYD